MHKIKNISILAAWNLKAIYKNPRVIMCAIMAFLLSCMLSNHIIIIANQYRTDIQVLELFIWCFSDSDSVLFAALVLMLLLSSLPNLGPETAYLIFRTDQITWLIAQMLTMVIVTAIYVFLLLFSCILLGLGISYTTNQWSETALLLSYMPAESETAVEVVRRAMLDTSPYQCAFDVFLLLEQYMLLLSMLQLTATLTRNKRAGVLVVLSLNLTSYILTPSRFITWLQLDSNLQYIANLLSVWLSPLQHATYSMHTFGYDSLPTLFASNIIMMAISLILVCTSFLLLKKYYFHFLGGDENA